MQVNFKKLIRVCVLQIEHQVLQTNPIEMNAITLRGVGEKRSNLSASGKLDFDLVLHG